VQKNAEYAPKGSKIASITHNQPTNYTLSKQIIQTISLCLAWKIMYTILMNVVNKTKSAVLTENLIIASSVKNRALGLLIRDEKQSLLITTRFGIHTLGMKHPIDVIVLDNLLTVVKIKKNLRPNQVFLWNPKNSTVLELPKETIKRSKTTLGDIISIEKSI